MTAAGPAQGSNFTEAVDMIGMEVGEKHPFNLAYIEAHTAHISDAIAAGIEHKQFAGGHDHHAGP